MPNKTIKVILVDDEASAHENLTDLLTRFCPEVAIVGNASNVDQAITLIQNTRPDVVFLDIEMPHKSGFELINAFTNVDFHIIFVTAYDQYALKAFEVSAIDYLLKPVVVERLREAIQKVIQQQQQNYGNRFDALKTNTTSNTFKKLAIPYRSDYAIVSIEDIITIEAERMYSKLLVSYPRKNTVRNYLYAKKLSYFENLFEQLPHFYRVHRSWIINTHHLHTYSKQDRCITLENGMEIPVSKTRKHDFETFLGF